MNYDIFCIPEHSFQIRKFRLTPRRISFIGAGLVGVVLLLALSAVGFLHYWALYTSMEKDREAITAYENERADLLNKVAMLEGAVGHTEQMAGNLAAMVGTERVSLKRGIGPLPPEKAGVMDIAAKTAPVDLSALEPANVDRLQDRVQTLQEKIKELTKIQQDKLTYIASTPSIWPVKGWVTSEFGYRRSPFTLAADFHEGIDIAAAWGTPIVAPADGVVTYAGPRNGYGNLVVIDHGFGIVTRYGHTSQIFVKEGDKVTRGMKIAQVGTTGHSTGPHLHYEIHSDGVPVDPMKYILR
jgi:peptidase M23-like protein